VGPHHPHLPTAPPRALHTRPAAAYLAQARQRDRPPTPAAAAVGLPPNPHRPEHPLLPCARNARPTSAAG
jgi:hypothetical protein